MTDLLTEALETVSRRDFERQQDRSLGCLRALREAAKFARDRQAVCEAARDRYKIEKPDEPYWHMSEQCAAHEARLIADHLEQSLKDIERRFKIPRAAAETEGG